MVLGMRRSGTGFRGRFTAVWPCLLCLCGSGCGDSVVVAREFSLVSAAVESRDAGSDADERGLEPPFGFGHGGTGSLGQHPPSHLGAGGSHAIAPAHDKDDDGSGGGGGSGGSSGSGASSGSPQHS
jgi:hypothetical protein